MRPGRSAALNPASRATAIFAVAVAAVGVALKAYLLPASVADPWAALRAMASALLPSSAPPPPFLFGVASSAFQIEGAGPAVDGKGPSIWDTFSHTPGKVANNDTGDVACDFYNRYAGDVELMKGLGVSAFRFSLSWSRILPTGRGRPNPAGIAFYHRLLDALAAAGIEPHISLYHWDLPQALEDEYGGWLSPRSVADFAAYADLAFREYGPRVRYWSTFNEPYTFAFCGYAYGIHAPGRCSDRAKCEGGGDSDTEPWLVSHRVLLAHAEAVKRFRARVPGGLISMNLNAEWAEPASGSADDADAAARYLDFQLGLYAEPVFLTGDYPASVRARVPSLPRFTPAQSAALKGSADYFALNHYTSRWVRATPRGDPAGAPADAEALTELDGKPIGPRAASFWLFAVPWGFRKLLSHVDAKYARPAGNLDVWITESGCDGPGEATTPLPAVLDDTFRTNYYKGYVAAAVDAAKTGGVPIKGYFAWSLLDNFEWAEGYGSRFGITYVDYGTQERYPKASAKWLAARFKGAPKTADGKEAEKDEGGGGGGRAVESVSEM